MSEQLKVYDVTHNGVPARMKLNEADAKRYGVWDEPKKETTSTAQTSAPTKKRVAKDKAASSKGD